MGRCGRYLKSYLKGGTDQACQGRAANWLLGGGLPVTKPRQAPPPLDPAEKPPATAHQSELAAFPSPKFLGTPTSRAPFEIKLRRGRGEGRRRGPEAFDHGCGSLSPSAAGLRPDQVSGGTTAAAALARQFPERRRRRCWDGDQAESRHCLPQVRFAFAFVIHCPKASAVTTTLGFQAGAKFCDDQVESWVDEGSRHGC